MDDHASDAGQSKGSQPASSPTPWAQDSGSGSFRGTPVSFGDAKIDEYAATGDQPGSPTKFEEEEDGGHQGPGLLVRMFSSVLNYYRRMMRPWSEKTGYDMYL